jgi:hypothetical protein
MKHRNMMVGEYTKGLPLLLLLLAPNVVALQDDHSSMIPTRYKILIRIDDELKLAGIIAGICFFNQNMILYKTSFIRLE